MLSSCSQCSGCLLLLLFASVKEEGCPYCEHVLSTEATIPFSCISSAQSTAVESDLSASAGLQDLLAQYGWRFSTTIEYANHNQFTGEFHNRMSQWGGSIGARLPPMQLCV